MNTPMRNPAYDNVRYEVITQEHEESGDLLIPIPQPLLERLGWKEGMEVEFGIDAEGRLYLKKGSK